MVMSVTIYCYVFTATIGGGGPARKVGFVSWFRKAVSDPIRPVSINRGVLRSGPKSVIAGIQKRPANIATPFADPTSFAHRHLFGKRITDVRG